MKRGTFHFITLLAVLAVVTAARAQVTNTNTNTNTKTATNAVASVVTNVATNAVTITKAETKVNAVTTTKADTKPDTAAPASYAPVRENLQAFQIVETRNIFDPNRRAIRPRDNTPRDIVEYFGLSGAITYENQAYALFDGSGPIRTRTYKPADKINGYTIATITNNSVKLEAGSNQVITLVPGMQMRRVNNGPWALVPSSVPAADTGSSGSSADPGDSGASTLSGPAADVIARLMKRRAEENKDQSTGATGEGTGTNEIH